MSSGSKPAVIGKSFTFAGQSRSVIGIMKPEFRFPDERVAYWVPMPRSARDEAPWCDRR